LLLLLTLLSVADARSWCASPLLAHEWGVTVLRADGPPAQGVPMPSWLHRSGPVTPIASVAPVRAMPADNGMRTLPVVQFYSPPSWGDPIPLGAEVGFTNGRAILWFPQVDRRVLAAVANSSVSAAARAAMVEKRQEHGAASPGADPTRQLHWEALSLHRAAPGTLLPAEEPWVTALRAMPEALWVRRGEERERFLFYEADTHEAPALTIERGESWGPDRPHYILTNRSDWTVHDVVIIADGKSWQAPAIPPGATAGFLLDAPLQAEEAEDWLRQRWSSGASSATSQVERDWFGGDCVMMRNPAVPVEAAEGHRLYEEEVAVLLDVWSERLLESSGVHLVYREDTAALDAVMPVSLYTDMVHFFEWRRLGVVLVEGLSLP
jgi:hypothetical protein